MIFPFLMFFIPCAILPVFVNATSFTLTNAPASRTDRVYFGEPGPWGRLQYTRILLEPPADYVRLDPGAKYDHVAWHFPGFNRKKVEALFQKAELTSEQLTTLLDECDWENQTQETVVSVPRDLILALSPKSRARIYGVLSRFEINSFQYQPFVFQQAWIDEQFLGTKIGPNTIAEFKKLLYPKGNALLFADAGPMFDLIPNPADREKLFRILSRRSTFLAKLEITSATDVKQLSDYWDYSGASKELEPLLESLTRLPQGTFIDMVHLLPPFARKRVFSFPLHGDPLAIDRNCHWTAFNFFNDLGDDGFLQTEHIERAVSTEYTPVTGDWKLGDLIVLFGPTGDSIHSCVYIADDLVFTKNGSGLTQPYIYMHVRDMLDLYIAEEDPEYPISMQLFRKKSIQFEVK